MRYAAFVLFFLGGCCLPPEDEIICTTPMTNNPHVIPQRAQSPIPGM